jgi:hypothetical protein
VAILYLYGPNFRLTEVWCGCNVINSLTEHKFLQVLTGLSSSKDFNLYYEILLYENLNKSTLYLKILFADHREHIALVLVGPVGECCVER